MASPANLGTVTVAADPPATLSVRWLAPIPLSRGVVVTHAGVPASGQLWPRGN